MGGTVNDIFMKHGVTLSDDELEHSGVKGMRWGQRKRDKKEAAAVAAAKPKAKDMDDDQLKSAINRIKLEKEYAKLTAPEISEGRKIVGRILKDVGEQQAKNYLNKNVEKLMVGGIKGTIKVAAKAAAPPAARQVMQFNKRPGF